MSNKIELMMLCGVLQSNFSCLSQSESRIQPCHVRMIITFTKEVMILRAFFYMFAYVQVEIWIIF